MYLRSSELYRIYRRYYVNFGLISVQYFVATLNRRSRLAGYEDNHRCLNIYPSRRGFPVSFVIACRVDLAC